MRPLHEEQINLLKQWRTLQKENNKDEADKILNHLLQSINAIANAIKTTG
ncbi:MAG: phosphoenolpyruvate carboxylase [Bacteroidales bacterium]|nr:phosphoenolpyruvate carboxylase [Bacteroidales bacterium]